MFELQRKELWTKYENLTIFLLIRQGANVDGHIANQF